MVCGFLEGTISFEVHGKAPSFHFDAKRMLGTSSFHFYVGDINLLDLSDSVLHYHYMHMGLKFRTYYYYYTN